MKFTFIYSAIFFSVLSAMYAAYKLVLGMFGGDNVFVLSLIIGLLYIIGYAIFSNGFIGYWEYGDEYEDNDTMSAVVTPDNLTYLVVLKDKITKTDTIKVSVRGDQEFEDLVRRYPNYVVDNAFIDINMDIKSFVDAGNINGVLTLEEIIKKWEKIKRG